MREGTIVKFFFFFFFRIYCVSNVRVNYCDP